MARTDGQKHRRVETHRGQRLEVRVCLRIHLEQCEKIVLCFYMGTFQLLRRSFPVGHAAISALFGGSFLT